MNHYSNKNSIEERERFDILKNRMAILIHSISELASMIDKSNSEAVIKIDEIYRESEEINRKIGVLYEFINRIKIDET